MFNYTFFFCRGFAFIDFERLSDAKQAKKAMEDPYIDGRRVRVDFSRSNGPHPKTPGIYLGRDRGGGSRYLNLN